MKKGTQDFWEVSFGAICRNISGDVTIVVLLNE